MIAALSILALTTLLMLAMAGLLRVESATADQNKQMQKARANAKLGLMVALGDLQKYAGPDQRVTATASILDSNPETPKADDVNNAHWVGVWRTDGFKDEAPDSELIEYSTGPMTDRRDSESYEPYDQTLRWLVSGENPDPLLPPDNAIQIYGAFEEDLPEEEGALPEEDKVYVSKVKIDQNEGNYAFWMSDESTKAKINLKKTDPSRSPDFSEAETYHPVLSPDSFDLSHLFTGFQSLDHEALEKVQSKEQLALVNIGEPIVGDSISKAVQLLNHDLTISSYSVLADPLNGGLKTNLTAFINSEGTVPPLNTLPGISDETPILADATARDVIGPKYGAIRSWYQLGEETTGDLNDRVIDMTYPNLTSGPQLPANDPGADDLIVDIADFTKQAIQPVLLDATYQYGYTYTEDPRRFLKLTYPRVVLWNPYNVKLRVPRLYVHFDFRLNLHKIPEFNYQGGLYNRMSEKNYGKLSWNGVPPFAYAIEATTFEPGECLLFTTAETGQDTLEGKAHKFSTSTINENLLSATADPAERRCFYEINSIPPIPGQDLTTMRLKYRWGGSIGASFNADPIQSVYLYAAKDTSANPQINDLGSGDFPALQKYYLDHFGRRFGNQHGRWFPGYTRPGFAQSLANHEPNSLTGFGMRWKHFYESFSNRVYGRALHEPWYLSPIAHHNVRARHVHRWPSDNAFGMEYTKTPGVSGGYWLLSHGVIGQTRQFPEWSEIVNSVSFNDGKYRTGPFFTADNMDVDEISTYPLFDIPDRDLGVHSLGALQHVQFSAHVWHPSYVIGNGFASPHIAPDSTGEENRDDWTEIVPYLDLGQQIMVSRMHQIGDDNMVFDISYETNHHIWDKHFLSSLPHDTSAEGWNGDQWDPAKPLPNSRMEIRDNVDGASDYDALTDFYRAAKHLMLSGGFNINSTSKAAWEALLRSFNEIELTSRDGGSSPAQFSRFLVPEVNSGDPQMATDRDLWAGYRNLSDQEISDLAEKIVVEVKKRAPFIGIGDFVNRRLGTPDGNEDDLHFFGTLQAAINQSGINHGLDKHEHDPSLPSHAAWNYILPNSAEAKSSYRYGTHRLGEPIDAGGYWGNYLIRPTPQEHRTFEYTSNETGEAYRLSEAIGAPGHLSQADILQQVGSVITARSDTFTIRAYGDVLDESTNEVVAQAWCEAVVQRLPEPVVPDPASGNLNPDGDGEAGFGRKFVVTQFRWLDKNEI